MSRDDRSWNDGDKLSFSERDRLRRERSGSEGRPRGVSQAKVDQATRQYVKQLDGMFSNERGAEVEGLAAEVRAAHGTKGLAEACRSYREAVGYPSDAALLSMFLDCADAELVVGSLEALRAACRSAGFKASSGLRSQIRMLAEDANDEVAELAEELNGQL